MYTCIYVYMYICRVSDRAVPCIADSPVRANARRAPAIVLHSPAWHRKARRVRSKARARIHLARASSCRPFSRDIQLLQSHHTKPFFRESGMGKKAAPWRDQQGSSSSHTWGYWRGSWNTRSPSKPETDGSKDFSEFRKYHQMGQGGEAAVGQVTGGGVGDGQGELGDPLVKGLQKLLNQARKFDARARKCQTDLQLREEQWSKYQAQLRDSFLIQRHAYQQDRRKLEEDMAEVKIQKARLVTQIQEVVQGRGRMAEPSSGQSVVASQDDLEAWSALMRDVQVEDQLDDQVIREALQAASSPDAFMELTLSQLAQSEPGSVPFTTPQRGITACPRTPTPGPRPPQVAAAPCSVTHS